MLLSFSILHAFCLTAVLNDADGRMGYFFSDVVLFAIMNKKKNVMILLKK